MDILALLLAAIVGTSVSLENLYAGVIAESEVNQYAERWGTQTRQALSYLEAGDMRSLQRVIDSQWPDISFSYSQAIVLYHRLGNHEATVENVLAVRTQSFADPAENLRHMAEKLDSCLAQASGRPLDRVNGDRELAALVCYNAGHYPSLHSYWWTTYGSHVSRYQAALHRARTELAEPPIP